MKAEEAKKLLEQEWEDIENYAISIKDPNLSTFELMKSYKSLNADERLLADQIIAEWVTSKDAVKRFNALVLVEDFNILTTLPQLRLLEESLKGQPGPVERDELETVRRIINKLIK